MLIEGARLAEPAAGPTPVTPDFRTLFESAPGLFLVLTPELKIVAASDLYLRATMTTRQQILGKGLFEVFPDNPDDPSATGTRNLRESLERVLRQRAADAMAVQKYDIRRPDAEGGGFEERYWSPVNSPVFAPDGRLMYIIHRVEDVTEFVRLQSQGREQRQAAEEYRRRAIRSEAETFVRAQELQEVNRELRRANERLHQEVAERTAAECKSVMLTQELRQLNDELDVRVRRRTAELVAAKEALSHEMAERTRAQERFRLAVEASPNAMLMVDPRGLILLVNRETERMFGYERDELLNQSVELIVPERFRSGHADFRAAYFADPTSRPMGAGRDLFGRRRDGTEFPVEIGLNPIQTEQDLYVLCAIVDITERKRAETALRERTQLTQLTAKVGMALNRTGPLRDVLGECAQALVDSLDAAFARIWTLNDAEQVLELQASAGMYTHLDGPHGRVPVGAFKIGLIAQERAPHLTNDVVADPRVSDREWARREGMAAFAGYPLIVEDRLVGVMAMFARHQLSQSTLNAMAAVAQQIATGIERKRAEQAQRESQLRLNEALHRLQLQIERMPLGYVLFDPDFTVVDWNPAAERIFGYVKSEALGMRPPFEKLVSPVFWDRGEDLLQRIRGGDMSAHSVNENLTKDGRSITCEWINTPLISEDGRFAGLMSLVQDVTARSRLEEQFRQAQKMEAVGKLAGGVAHDFNNLLTIILGYSEVLREGLSETEPLRELVDEIHNAGARAATLTRQLLAFSRKQMLAPVVLDLNGVLAEMEKMLVRLIGEDIDLAVKPAADVWKVKVDPGQVQQVVMNLVVNARDAMPQGGQLTLETANVELDEAYAASRPDARPGRFVVLAVSDTGCGMDAATLAHIFEPFFSTKGAQGTGLGLSTVYGIVKQSGGHIAVYSEPGCGTCFKVYLPREADDLDEQCTGVDAPASLKGDETVLLVEDEDGVRVLARTALELHGYSVLEARDGVEALALADAHPQPIHLLATDVVMPNMSGRELAERLLQRRPGMQVLFMSGYMDDAIVRHGLLTASVPFLQKPYTSAMLAGKVREVLDRHPA